MGAIYDRIDAGVRPCLADPVYRRIDFWFGEWDVRGAGSVRARGPGTPTAPPDIAASALPRLAVERQERHARYGGSPFLLEPEVKHGCGGLRDLDVVRWTLALRWGVRSFRRWPWPGPNCSPATI